MAAISKLQILDVQVAASTRVVMGVLLKCELRLLLCHHEWRSLAA
ncbi:MAG TPA: hypothetical protein VKP66_21105 [Steroidobacteraceae bacterium]|nr:hypothetical protein [Steroidobacteraceae bacterium]